MNAKLWILSLLTLGYFLAAQWFYSNKIAGVCCGGAATEVAATSSTTKAAIPLAFQLNSATPVDGLNFEAYKNDVLLKGMTDDNILQITGLYFADEEAVDGHDNMGIARAAAMRELLKANIPLERIDISSRLGNDAERSDTAAFSGIRFNWMAAPEKESTTIVALDDEVTIYFPFNSTVKDQNSKVDDYLNKLAERLQQTTEKVTITGHTDDVGEDAANLELGQRRAESIRDILVKRGIESTRIQVDSKGERQPATANETEDGRHRNRRTVLRII